MTEQTATQQSRTPTSEVTPRLGQVLRDGDDVRLEFVRHYDADINDVWSAVIDPDRMERWIGRWSGDPSTGSVDFVMTAEGVTEGQPVTVSACTPPRHLAVVLPSPDGPWPITVDLAEEDGGTTLRFVHLLAEPYDASSVGPGWQYYLDRLGAVIADEQIPDDWNAYHPRFADAYPIPVATG
jgi:uncharacterized protein YndB with AHSA1/START domain